MAATAPERPALQVLAVEQACRAELAELGRRFHDGMLFCDPDFKAGAADALGAALTADRCAHGEWAVQQREASSANRLP